MKERPFLAKATHRHLVRLLLMGSLFLLWECAARFWVDPMFLSPPSRVFGQMDKLLARPGVLEAYVDLLAELLIAFVVSVVLGLMLGLAVGLAKRTRERMMPIVLLLYGTPQITILPIVMLAAGVGFSSKVIFGITHGVFPVLLSVASSLQKVSPIYHVSARAMGATPWQKFRYILLPVLLPSFFSSLRLSMIACLLGVLLAELFASTKGIGFFTRQFTDTFDPTSLFGLISVAVVLAIGLNASLAWIESRWVTRQWT